MEGTVNIIVELGLSGILFVSQCCLSKLLQGSPLKYLFEITEGQYIKTVVVFNFQDHFFQLRMASYFVRKVNDFINS